MAQVLSLVGWLKPVSILFLPKQYRSRHTFVYLQVFKDASHALLQEANVNLAQLMRDEGFYVQKRRMSAPIKKRSKASFGSAAPIELPTMRELDIFAEGYALSLCVSV